MKYVSCRHLLSLLVLVLPIVAGCTSTKTTNTARTAKEQLLLSNAVDQSLDKVDFTPMYGQKVFLEEKYLDCVDKSYVIGSLRHRILRSGGLLIGTADDADVVMEIRSGGVGTDSSDAFVGSPEIVLPGMLTLPEVRFFEKRAQFGYSKLAIVTYDAKSKQALGDGGVAVAKSDDNNWYAFGLGPYQHGSLKSDIAKSSMIPPGTNRRQLPTQVVLTSPGAAAEGGSVRFASEAKKQ